MAVIEVVCPNPACGARLKAPEDRIGKKAKCNKCQEGFRIPGPIPMAESVEEPMLSSMALPAPALPEPVGADEPAPAKPAFGSGAPAKPAPRAAAPAPVAAAAPAKPTKPAARPVPAEEPIPEADLAEEPPASKPKAKAKKVAEPEPASLPEPAPADNPFSFGSDEPAEKPRKSRRRAEEEDEEEDERPRKKKRDDDEAEEKPRKKKRDDESEDEDDRPRKKKRDEQEGTDTTAAEPEPAGNPFSFGFGDEPKPAKPQKSKRRTEDEDEDDKPRKKKRAAEEDESKEDDRPRKKKRDEEDETDTKTKKVTEPEPAPAGDPFSFGLSDEPEPEKPKKSKRRAEDEDEDERPRKKKRDEEDEDKPRKKKRAAEDAGADEPDDKPRYKRPEEKGGMGKALALSAAVALVALGLAAAAAVVYVRSNRPAEVKKEEKKEEPPAPVVPPPVVPPPANPKEKGEPKPKDKEPEPKPKDKEPEPKPKEKEPEPAPARPAVVLDGKFRSVTVGKEPAKFDTRADQPGEPRFTIDTPFASVVRVFPPFDPKASDAYVLTRTGVRYSLDAYSPSSGARVSRLEFAADPKPLCDVFATATDARFLAVSAGRVTVWKLADQTKLADAIDPYADKPAHAKNGLAAVYFSPNPGRIVTVSTAGAVHLFDLGTKAVVAEFVPPHGAKGAVAPGESVARFGADSLALAVGGVVYQIKSADLTRVRTHDLGGDVKPLAIASAGAAGRLAFAFEAEFKGKKEKERALLVLPLQGDRRDIFLLPAATGTPKGAFWVHDTEVGVVTERGVVWFGEDEGKFGPVVVTRPPADGLYAGSGGFFWLLVPRPTNAAQSFLVPLAVPFGDAAEFRGGGAGKPLRVVRIDQNGLAK